MSRINGDHQAHRDVFGLQYSGERQCTKSAHRMSDQDDRSGIVTVIADGLIGDQPANGEFVDVSPDAGFLRGAWSGDPSRARRSGRARHGTGRRAPAAGSRLAAQPGRSSRQHRSSAATGPASRQIATGREDAGGKSRPDHHGRNLHRIAHARSIRNSGVSTDLNAPDAIRRSHG